MNREQFLKEKNKQELNKVCFGQEKINLKQIPSDVTRIMPIVSNTKCC